MLLAAGGQTLLCDGASVLEEAGRIRADGLCLAPGSDQGGKSPHCAVDETEAGCSLRAVS